MSEYQRKLIEELKRKQAANKGNGFESPGLRDRIAELEKNYKADEAARAERLAKKKAAADAQAKAREAAEDAELKPKLKPEWLSRPGATEADFERQWPWIKAAHLQRSREEAIELRRAQMGAHLD